MGLVDDLSIIICFAGNQDGPITAKKGSAGVLLFTEGGLESGLFIEGDLDLASGKTSEFFRSVLERLNLLFAGIGEQLDDLRFVKIGGDILERLLVGTLSGRLDVDIGKEGKARYVAGRGALDVLIDILCALQAPRLAGSDGVVA